MIVKAPDSDRSAGVTDAAEPPTEQAVASHLRRAFKTDPDVFVFNDLTLFFEGEVVEIDHLVLHRGGMVVIESRSVTGEVVVNALAEWTHWAETPLEGELSPAQRAGRHEAALRAVLAANSQRLRDRARTETEQARSGLDWPIDILIVAGDACRITREVDVPELCRVDQVTGEIDAIIERRTHAHRSLVHSDDGAQRLSPAELGRLVQCLSSSHAAEQPQDPGSVDEEMLDPPESATAAAQGPVASSPGSTDPRATAGAPESAVPPEPWSADAEADVESLASCETQVHVMAPVPSAATAEGPPSAPSESREAPGFDQPVVADRTLRRPAREEPPPFCGDCGSLEVHMRYARTSHPYYFRCDRCGGITPARWECSVCGTPARIVKRGSDFFRVCKTCNTSEYFFTNPKITRTV